MGPRVNSEIEKRGSAVEIQKSLMNAMRYMNDNGGRMRVDLGIDIWGKGKKIDEEVRGGNYGVVDTLVTLIKMSKKGSNEESFFSALALREMLVAESKIGEWKGMMVENLWQIEDFGGGVKTKELRKIYGRNKVKIGEIMYKSFSEGVNLSNMVESALGTIKIEDKKKVRERVEILVNAFGLDKKMSEDLINSWLSLKLDVLIKKFGSKEGRKTLRMTVLNNLSVLRDLKKEIGNEGIDKLYREYGITNFGRYPAKILADQIRDEGTEKAYGIWLGPYTDWNGAFVWSESNEMVERLKNSAKSLGLGLKIVEARDKMTVVRRVVGLDKKFGRKNKIAFVVISGHGDPQNVQLGTEDDDSLGSEDLKKESAGKMRKYFADKVPFLFNSCETGLGIGPEYSRFGNSYSLSPDKVSSKLFFELKRDKEGNLFFDGEYYYNRGNKPEAMLYKNGLNWREKMEKEKEILRKESF